MKNPGSALTNATHGRDFVGILNISLAADIKVYAFMGTLLLEGMVVPLRQFCLKGLVKGLVKGQLFLSARIIGGK